MQSTYGEIGTTVVLHKKELTFRYRRENAGAFYASQLSRSINTNVQTKTKKEKSEISQTQTNETGGKASIG